MTDVDRPRQRRQLRDARPCSPARRRRTTKRRRGGMLGFAGWLSIVWLTFVVLGAILADLAPPQGPEHLRRPQPEPAPEPAHRHAGLPARHRRQQLGHPLPPDLGRAGVAHRRLRRAHDRHGDRRRRSAWSPASCRGRTETVLMAIVDIFLAFPALILLIAIVAFLGSDLKNVVLGISLVSIPAFARIARATTLTFSRREFVLAAEAAGASRRAHPRARDPAQRGPPAAGLRAPRGRHRHRRRGQPRLPRPHLRRTRSAGAG